jgi:hypothetical protein
MEARILMEAVHGGFEIAQVDTLENAQVIADALNLYSQVAALVQQQESEDAHRATERITKQRVPRD